MPDIATRTVAWAGAVIAAVVACAIAAVLLLLHAAGVPPGGDRFGAGRQPRAQDAPGLSPAPQPELRHERAAGRERLHGAGWVDAEAGVAHIPIEDAMDLLVARRAKEPPR